MDILSCGCVYADVIMHVYMLACMHALLHVYIHIFPIACIYKCCIFYMSNGTREYTLLKNSQLFNYLELHKRHSL